MRNLSFLTVLVILLIFPVVDHAVSDDFLAFHTSDLTPAVLPTSFDLFAFDEHGHIGIFSNMTQTFLYIQPPNDVISDRTIPVADKAVGLKYFGNDIWGILFENGHLLLVDPKGNTKKEIGSVRASGFRDMTLQPDGSFIVISDNYYNSTTAIKYSYNPKNHILRRSRTRYLPWPSFSTISPKNEIVLVGFASQYIGLFNEVYVNLYYFKTDWIENKTSEIETPISFINSQLIKKYSLKFKNSDPWDMLLERSDLFHLAVSKQDEIYVLAQTDTSLANRMTICKFSEDGKGLDSFTVSVFPGDSSPLAKFEIDLNGNLWLSKEKEPRLIQINPKTRQISAFSTKNLSRAHCVHKAVDWISPNEAARWIDSPTVDFLDVSAWQEFASIHARKSRSFSHTRVNELEDKFSDKSHIFILTGRHIMEVENVFQQFRDRGYHHLYMIKGGTAAWEQAGLPIEKGNWVQADSTTFQIKAYEIEQQIDGEWISVANFAYPTPSLFAKFRPYMVKDVGSETKALRLTRVDDEMLESWYGFDHIESKIKAAFTSNGKIWVGFGFQDEGEGIVGYGGIGYYDLNGRKTGVLRHPGLIDCSVHSLMVTDGKIYAAGIDHDQIYGGKGFVLFEINIKTLRGTAWIPPKSDNRTYYDMPVSDILSYSGQFIRKEMKSWDEKNYGQILQKGLYRYMEAQAAWEMEIRRETYINGVTLAEQHYIFDDDRKETYIERENTMVHLAAWPKGRMSEYCPPGGFYGLRGLRVIP